MSFFSYKNKKNIKKIKKVYELIEQKKIEIKIKNRNRIKNNKQTLNKLIKCLSLLIPASLFRT